MVCLKHVDDLCSTCSPNSFLFNFDYTLDELDELEQSLAKCLTNFYSWRNELNMLLSLIQSDQSGMKDHVHNQISIIKPESVMDKNDGYSINGMTLSDLEVGFFFVF